MKIARCGVRVGGVLALVGALALAGCASSAEEPAEPEAPAETSELSGELTLYAAASLKAAFDTLADEFTQVHPDVTFAPTVYDGSSTLATQLASGAPADIFASADERNMQTVLDDGLIAGEAPLFATNVLVLAVEPGNPLGFSSLADLTEPVGGEEPIVVVCAAEVPCGNASSDLLEAAGVELTPASEEQNVSAVLAKLVAGEADAGLVYRTDVMGADGGVDAVEIEGSDERPNRYPIGVLERSTNPEAAAAFSEFVRSAAGQAVLAEFGFGAP